MDTQKIMRLADIYAERCNDHQRHATEETHHDMMLFRNALEAEATRLHSVNAELLEVLQQMQLALSRCFGPHKAEESDRHRALAASRAAIAEAQE